MFGRSLLILSSTYFWSSSAKFDSSRAMNIIIKHKRKKINESQRLSFFIEKSQELIGLTPLLGVQNRNMKRFVSNAVDRLAKKNAANRIGRHIGDAGDKLRGTYICKHQPFKKSNGTQSLKEREKSFKNEHRAENIGILKLGSYTRLPHLTRFWPFFRFFNDWILVLFFFKIIDAGETFSFSRISAE